MHCSGSSGANISVSGFICLSIVNQYGWERQENGGPGRNAQGIPQKHTRTVLYPVRQHHHFGWFEHKIRTIQIKRSFVANINYWHCTDYLQNFVYEIVMYSVKMCIALSKTAENFWILKPNRPIYQSQSVKDSYSQLADVYSGLFNVTFQIIHYSHDRFARFDTDKIVFKI